MKELLSRIRLIDIKESLSAYYPSIIRMAGAGFQFLSAILIARKLGSEGSSDYLFWSAILMTSAPMATYGLEQLALRDVPRLEKKGVSFVRRYLEVVRIISVSLALLIGGGLLIYAGLSDGWALWQICIPIALAAFSSTLINGEVLKGLSCPNRGMIFGHFIPVALFTCCVILFVILSPANQNSPAVRAGHASILLLLFWFGCFVTGTILARFSGRPEMQGQFIAKPDPVIFRNLIKEGRSVFIGSVFGALSFMVPLVILKEFRPPEEVSYVTTAFRISILFNILLAAVFTVFAPKISMAAEKMNGSEIFKVYSKAILFALVALGPPQILGIIFPEFMMGIFGDGFTAGANSLRLLLASNLITLMLGPVLLLLIMIGENKHLPKFGIGKLLVAAIGSLILVPQFGGVGMILAMAGAFFLEEALVLIYIILKIRKSSAS